MQTKNQTPIVRKISYVIMLLGVFLSAFGTNNLSIAKASESQQEDEFGYTINSGSYELPEDLISALKLELSDIESESGNATIYGVGYFEKHSNWSWINLVVANGEYYNNNEVGPMFLYFATKLNEDWTVVLSSNDTKYKSTLDQISREGLTDEEINLLNDYYSLNRNEPVPDINALAGNLLFPWPSTQNSWHTGSLGFHAAGFSSLGVESGALAIDMIPPSSVSSATIIAMESGAIVNKLECTWNTVLIIRHDGYPDSKKFVYLHIQNGTTPGIGSINRGSNLGTLRYPTMNGTCSGYPCEIDYNPATGNPCSQSTTRHLHLGIGTDTSIVIDGRVASTLLGTSLTSSNSTGGGGGGTGQGCDQVSYNGVRLYEHANCNRDTNGGTKSFSSTTGMTDIVSDFNDITSSIYVGSGWSVKVFEKSVGEGGGSWRCMTGSMWDLNVDYYTNGDVNRKINDDISSVQIYNNNNCGSGGGTSASWNARYFNGQDHWWDNNNFNNQMCEETINTTGLDKNYGSSAPCGNGVSDNWVAEYNSTVYFPAGSYVFYAQNDDGLKIWVNGSNIMERGGSSGYYPRCPALNLNGNTPIRAILREEGGDARVKIAWSTETSVCIPPGSFDKSSPTNGATGVSTSPTLIWGSSSNSAGYNYCIDTSNNNNCDTGWQSVGSLTSKSLSGLTAGTTYYWQARSNNEGGEVFANGGTWWSFTTQPNVPNIPQNLRVSGSTSNSITLAWDDVSNETGYKIYQWEGAQGFVYLATVGANQTTYTETRVNCGWDEYYTVSAYNGNGDSEQSGWVQGFTLACPSGPAIPALNSPANNSTLNRTDTINLSWSSASGATQYYAEFWGGPSINVNSGWTANTSWSLGSQWGGTYQWRVKAKNGSGQESAWSETRTLNIKPGTPSNLSPTVLSSDQIALTWTKSSDGPNNIDGYRIYRNGVAVGTVPSSSTTYQNNGLTCNTNYSFFVRAYKGSVESNSSNTSSATTQVCPPAIRATEISTRDGNWGLKSSFNPNDPIQWTIHVENTTSVDVSVDIGYIVRDPNNTVILNHTQTISASPGTWLWGLPGTVTGPGGTYTFTGSVTYQGVKTERTITYTVVSTSPTTATFGDVPMSHPYWEDVEILYANGLTAGCSTTSLLFCPDMTMNRAQSAVFMVRGNFGNTYSPPPAPWLTFGDDFSPGPWAQPWAQGMFDAGLTAGCSTSPRLFCPWEEMPRLQAAVFGLRMKYGISYPPPVGTGTVFADINGSEWFSGWAEQAYAEGMLPACGFSGGKPLFCPNELVSRGLGAYMIVRAKNLSMP